MIRRSLFLFFLFCSIIFSVFPKSNTEMEARFIIRNVSYTIKGKTREAVFRHYLDIQPEESFLNENELIFYLEKKNQLIKNQRTLDEGYINTSYTIDPDNSKKTFVDIDVYIKDTWNYLILPYPKYDSNTGLLLGLRGRDYNFLGGMKTLSLNFDYLIPDNDKPEYSFNGGFVIPFYLWDYNWKFRFDEDITISSEYPLEAYTKAGISIDIPVSKLTWQGSIDQYHYLNQKEDDKDGYYMRTEAKFGGLIQTGLILPLLAELSYSPSIITNFNYKPFETLSEEEERKAYELGVSHEIFAGRINWYGNFRNGASFSVDQDLRYNFITDQWLSDHKLEFQLHKSFGWGGISTRLEGSYLYNNTSDEIEDIGEPSPIRGILNDRLTGNNAVFLNIDFPVKIWIWFLSRWFEGHISPFLDYAIIKPENENFSFDEVWYSGGIEGFAFLKAARSTYLRMSLGVDLEAILDGAKLGDPAPRDGASIYTLFIGLGHHY